MQLPGRVSYARRRAANSRTVSPNLPIILLCSFPSPPSRILCSVAQGIICCLRAQKSGVQTLRFDNQPRISIAQKRAESSKVKATNSSVPTTQRAKAKPIVLYFNSNRGKSTHCAVGQIKSYPAFVTTLVRPESMRRNGGTGVFRKLVVILRGTPERSVN